MKLYHGTYLDIGRIDLKLSMKGKDFGQGFYLSDNIEQAKAFAKLRSLGKTAVPVVNVYECTDFASMGNDIKIKTFDEYSEEWAEFVLLNRKNRNDTPLHDFDIVYGPIADDKIGQQIRKFMDGEITMETFIERLKYIKGITYQYYFGTDQAISCLTKLPSIYE